MDKKEFFDIINRKNEGLDISIPIINKVKICDVEVESSVETLDNCKRVAEEIIKRNQQFITLRNNKVKIDAMGYLG